MHGLEGSLMILRVSVRNSNQIRAYKTTAAVHNTRWMQPLPAAAAAAASCWTRLSQKRSAEQRFALLE